MDWTPLLVPKLNAELKTTYKRKPEPRRCFIRRYTRRNSQIIHSLATISAKLELKDSRGRFIGTREEDKKQAKLTLEMVFFKCVNTLYEI